MPFEFLEEETEVEQRPFDTRLFRRMMGYVAPYRRPVAAMAGAILAATGVTLFEPYILGKIVDNGISAGDMQAINRLTLMLLGLHILAWFGNNTRIRLTAIVGQGVLYDLRRDLFNHIQRLSLRFYDQRPVGRIMSRITSDVNAIAELINSGLVTVFSQSISIVGILAIMLWMSWQLALVAFITVPLLILLFAKLRPAIETSWKNVRKAQSNINANLNESINGMQVTQAFGREQQNQETFQKLTQASNNAFMRAVRLEELIWPSVDFVGVLGTSLVVVVGGWLILRGDLTAGFILAFVGYLWRFWGPISAMSRIYGIALGAMASAERIFEFLDMVPEVDDKPDAYEMPEIQGNVQFEGVDFRYEPDQELVLQNINLSVQAGETIALVGPTGSGKSSIINLLLRFYDPVAGRVLVDGHDLRDLKLASIRRQMAIVLQDNFIFSGTLAENIGYAVQSDAKVSEDDVRRVAQAVHLDPFVQTLEDGYDHEVGERGGRLSAGQRQLVAFARALLADPRILILDEATSSVDAETERIIQEAMHTLLHGRTAFIIAHRLSTVRNADRILVIEAGRIVESGTHEELLRMGGRYRDLYLTQFAGQLPQVSIPQTKETGVVAA